MEILMLTVFASLVLAACGVLFFAWNVRERAHEHIEQLSLLPLDDELDPRRTAVSKQPKETA
jgi:cbb3-type cytochrome oxidase maturation protein